jgi:hypothetical protein
MLLQAFWLIFGASLDLSRRKCHHLAVEYQSRLCGSALNFLCVTCKYLNGKDVRHTLWMFFAVIKVMHTRFCLWSDEDQLVWPDPNHVASDC